MPTFDAFQQTFMISRISNAMRGFTGTQRELQPGFQHAVPRLLKDSRLKNGWEVVWGPVVWKKNPNDSETGPDHSWFIAKNTEVEFEDRNGIKTNHKTYIIAIADAGKSSKYDWINVDFNVSLVVDVAAWVAGGLASAPSAAGSIDLAKSYISLGTAMAVHKILNEKPPAGAISPGVSLHDFIRNLPNEASKLILTGHGLGATICPTAAFALISSGTIGSSITAYTYPTAGASPGNKKFAEEFATKFPQTSPKSSKGDDYKVWNCNIFNTRDAVPQQWCMDARLSPRQDLDNIIGIYGLPRPHGLQNIVNRLKKNAGEAGIAYYPLPGRHFHHPRPAAAPATLDRFVEEARAQHVPAYDTFLHTSWTAKSIRAYQGAVAGTSGEIFPAMSCQTENEDPTQVGVELN